MTSQELLPEAIIILPHDVIDFLENNLYFHLYNICAIIHLMFQIVFRLNIPTDIFHNPHRFFGLAKAY